MQIYNNNSSQAIDSIIQQKAPQSTEDKVLQQENADKGSLSSDKNMNPKKPKEEMAVSEKTLIDAIEKANKALDGPNKRFEFSIHKPSNQIVVKVIDKDTGDMIREIPPHKVLDMVSRIWDMSGIMVDEKR